MHFGLPLLPLALLLLLPFLSAPPPMDHSDQLMYMAGDGHDPTDRFVPRRRRRHIPAAAAAVVLALLMQAATHVGAWQPSYAWVNDDGAVVQTSPTAPLNVTRVGVGHYCFDAAGSSMTDGACHYCWAPVQVTPQRSPSPSTSVVIVNTRSGSGSDELCRTLGGTSVRIFDAASGSPQDSVFSLLVLGTV